MSEELKKNFSICHVNKYDDVIDFWITDNSPKSDLRYWCVSVHHDGPIQVIKMIIDLDLTVNVAGKLRGVLIGLARSIEHKVRP